MKKAKQGYFENLNGIKFKDSRKFWKVIKPFFTDKTSIKEKMPPIENGDVSDNEKTIAKIFNYFFASVAKNMDLPKPPKPTDETVTESDDYV